MTVTARNIETALSLAASGLAIFPCHSGGEKVKQPMPFIRWRDVSTTNERQIRDWWGRWPDAAVGLDLAKSGLLVIDCDRHGAADGVMAYGDLVSAHNHDPDSSPIVATPNEGNHVYFRQPAGKALGNGRGALPAGIDVRGAGGYVIGPGTIMQDGRLYELFGSLDDAPELPAWLSALLEKKSAPPISRRSTVSPAAGSEIEELLSHIPSDCGYDEWLQVLMAIHAETGGTGLDIADAWSARGSKYKGRREIEAKWRSFRRDGVTGATLAVIARRYGADLSAIAISHMMPDHDPVEAAAAARRLIEAHDGVLADAQTGEIVDAPIVPAKFATLQYPDGLVGRIAMWIARTARRPQPELAIGAALAVIGTLAGRQFEGPTESATHLYVLGIAPTGTGKDHALQQIGRLMTAAKLSHHLGPSEFISMPAVVNFLMRKPLSICAMDEFGSFMKRINGRNASGFESAISKVIRTMWSTSFSPYSTPEWAQKASEIIHSPAITLYGASTPEQFYSAMEGASLEDGTLNRFLLINGRPDVGEVEPTGDKSIVPDDIAQDMGFIYYRSGMTASTWRNDPHADPAAAGQLRKTPWCPDGSHQRYMAFSEEVQKRMAREPENGPFFARTAEMAVRIATIIAIGRLDDDQVRMSDLEYGINVALRSAEMMQAGALDYMAENQNQADAQKIMRIIRARGGRCRYRDLVQSLKNSIKARDLKDILQSLCDGEQIEKSTVKPAIGGHEVIWYQMI